MRCMVNIMGHISWVVKILNMACVPLNFYVIYFSQNSCILCKIRRLCNQVEERSPMEFGGPTRRKMLDVGP